MGTGKSTLGARLAERTGARFVDLDAAIEARAGKSVAAIFAGEGEAAFRSVERALLGEALASAARPTVIALGGGALVDPSARSEVMGRTLLVVLEADVDTIAERTRSSGARPLLAATAPGDRRAAIEELLAARAAAYQEAHLHLDTRGASVEALTLALVARWTGWRT
jgi:shikimate kinase